MTAPWLLALLAGTLTAVAGPPPAAPRVVCGSEGRCVVSRLPPALADPEVLDYLKSGLTTTLSLSLSGRSERGRKLAAAVRIDLRFEPWEETFEVVIRPPAGPAERRGLASEAALHAWWHELALAVRLPATPRDSARVSLGLVPFSEEEEEDTRRWYARALRAASAGEAGSADAGLAGLDGVVDSLTLTSIKRKGVLSFSWSARVERTP
jgi:hypothetical protein